MAAEIKTGGYRYELKFKKGKPAGKMLKEEYPKKDTGTRIRWKPDLEVFTDIMYRLSIFSQLSSVSLL